MPEKKPKIVPGGISGTVLVAHLCMKYEGKAARF